MIKNDGLIFLILVVGSVVSVLANKLTLTAGFTGFITGLLIYAGAGYTGIVMLAAFFVLGTFSTSWGIKRKEQSGLAERNKGKRTAGQVLANSGAASFIGLFVIVFQKYHFLAVLIIAATFASATADTLSSELGVIYGNKFYNIITFKKDERGLDGVISLEGTLIGIIGSTCIAIIYSVGYGFSWWFLMIIIAGTIGNLCDSILGATLERKHYVNNNLVNFLNTAIAAIFILMVYIFKI